MCVLIAVDASDTGKAILFGPTPGKFRPCFRWKFHGFYENVRKNGSFCRNSVIFNENIGDFVSFNEKRFCKRRDGAISGLNGEALGGSVVS